MSPELKAYQALKDAGNLLLKCKKQGSARYYWSRDVMKTLDQVFATLTPEEQAGIVNEAA